jgi:hypothetical protein
LSQTLIVPEIAPERQFQLGWRLSGSGDLIPDGKEGFKRRKARQRVTVE